MLSSMKTAALFLALSAYTSILQNAQFVDVLRPINVAVRRGQPVEFNCQSDSNGSIHTWKFKAVESNQDTVIYSQQVGLNNVTSFEARRGCDSRTCDLVTTATQVTDAGRYTCFVMVPVNGSDGLELIQRAAQLIVLDVEPNCSTNAGESVLEGQMLEMRCSIGFRGNWAPKMKWRQVGDGRVINNGVDTVTIPNSIVTSTLRTLNWTKSYMCTIYFDQPDGEIDNSLATNAPKYNFTWTFPAINVKASVPRDGAATSPHNGISLLIVILVTGSVTVLVFVAVLLKRICQTAKQDATGAEPPIVHGLNEGVYDEISDCAPDSSVARYKDAEADHLVPPESIKVLEPAQRQHTPSTTEENGIWRPFIGADGTIYTDTNNHATGSNRMQAEDGKGAPARPARFQVSEYASIDHTLRVPEPDAIGMSRIHQF